MIIKESSNCNNHTPNSLLGQRTRLHGLALLGAGARGIHRGSGADDKLCQGQGNRYDKVGKGIETQTGHTVKERSRKAIRVGNHHTGKN